MELLFSPLQVLIHSIRLSFQQPPVNETCCYHNFDDFIICCVVHRVNPHKTITLFSWRGVLPIFKFHKIVVDSTIDIHEVSLNVIDTFKSACFNLWQATSLLMELYQFLKLYGFMIMISLVPAKLISNLTP